MDLLFQKLGKPPYRLDQIVPLLDEASSFSSNPGESPAPYHDIGSAIGLAESIEALAWLAEFCLVEAFPQSAVEPDLAEIERLELYNNVYVSPTDRGILESIGLEVLRLKSWIFEGSHQPSQISVGTAQLCHNCNWSFERLAKGPYERSYLHELQITSSLRSPRYLLAIDDWPALPILKERSLQGCHFCLLILEKFLQIGLQKHEKPKERPVHVWIEFCYDLTRSLASVLVSLSGSDHFLKSLSFTIDTQHDNVATELGIFHSPATTPLDSANVDFIKRQISSTEDNMPINHYRPKRLLDVGSDTHFEPKLIDTQQSEVDLGGLKYGTLSYCWGSIEEAKRQLKLTTETQREFYSSIPLHLMTPVLRDAMRVCHILGLRYLWIDSLCIQQDGDGTDWEEQSEEMSHIFGNSWLTICAPASNSCLEGFLDHIDRHSRAIQIQYVAKKSQQIQGSFFLRLFTVDGKPGPYQSDQAERLAPLVRDLECSKWNTRGWVFQERILSPRLLYFGARMIHFQHGDHVTSEDGSSIDGDLFAPTFYVFRHCSTNFLNQLETIQKQGPYITDLWYRNLTVISSSDFTDRRDTLPAVAGMARRVHEFTKHRYLAGLWEEDLCCGLLWTPRLTIRDLEPRRAPASLRQLLQTIRKSTKSIAPSWSWASRRTCIKFMVTNQTNTTCRVRRHLRAEFEIMQSRVLIDGVNPYGRIDSAWVSLSGSSIKLDPSSLATMRGDHDRRELCELFPGLFAFIQTDWEPINTQKATGMKKQMRAHFQLLLVASCCSDWSEDSNTGPTDIVHCNGGAESEDEPPQHPQAGVWPKKDMTSKEVTQKLLEAMKSKYRDSFYQDSNTDFDAAVHCGLCADLSLRRDIWGLLIYPAGPTDTFYRVGTFFSRAQHGGSAIFQGRKPRRIHLI